MPLSRSTLLKPINALVIFLRLRDLLSRCSFRFNSNRRKIFKIVARYVGCVVFAFICYLCQPYGFMVLAWGLICLLLFFLRRLWWVFWFNCSVVLSFDLVQALAFDLLACWRFSPLPHFLHCRSILRRIRAVIPSSAPRHIRSSSRVKCAATWGDSKTSRVSSLVWATEGDQLKLSVLILFVCIELTGINFDGGSCVSSNLRLVLSLGTLWLTLS